jgi:hypothetical protein
MTVTGVEKGHSETNHRTGNGTNAKRKNKQTKIEININK